MDSNKEAVKVFARNMQILMESYNFTLLNIFSQDDFLR